MACASWGSDALLDGGADAAQRLVDDELLHCILDLLLSQLLFSHSGDIATRRQVKLKEMEQIKSSKISTKKNQIEY